MKQLKRNKKNRPFDKFVGILDKDFKIEDKRYNKIVGYCVLTTRNEEQKVW